MLIPDLLGNWELDDRGNIRSVPFPESEPTKEDIKENQYTLFVTTGGLFKKTVKTIQISIINSKPRNKKFEKRLINHIKEAIQKNISTEIIEQSGGINSIIEQIECTEWW